MKTTRNTLLAIDAVLKEIDKLEYDEDMYKDTLFKGDKSLTPMIRWQKFKYAATKNSNLFEKEILAISKVIQPDQKYQKFLTDKRELAAKFADKNDKGDLVRVGDNYVIQERRKEYDEELNVLKDKYSKEIAKREEEIESLGSFLNEETIRKSHYRISVTFFPSILTGNQLRYLLMLAKEDEDEIEKMMGMDDDNMVEEEEEVIEDRVDDNKVEEDEDEDDEDMDDDDMDNDETER